MTHYRVSFFKNLLSSDGHRFKCLQGQIDIRDSLTQDDAIEVASREFALQYGTRDWKLYADAIEVARAVSHNKAA
jgi:hypothetical protein